MCNQLSLLTGFADISWEIGVHACIRRELLEVLPQTIYVIRREILPSIYEKRWVSSSTPVTSVFGKRLRLARELRELPQDKLGVMIGLDESCASARMSRYERGVHEPPLATAKLIASALGVPLAYMYCEDDELAQLLWRWQQLPSMQKKRLSKEWSNQVAELLSTDTRS